MEHVLAELIVRNGRVTTLDQRPAGSDIARDSGRPVHRRRHRRGDSGSSAARNRRSSTLAAAASFPG